ncbi:hypothetical protein FVE85_3933 [Porphyridium purpureum]|uniref:Uncharacterized protein n=1 Tax=Porphyridium purpureum TaxID=35688 RepID=A0A5J4YRP9_PORPP|nr:hypothetical protein FVE85_3933 [Porphyridium purpureum]|eukprot:POR3076..scf229_5
MVSTEEEEEISESSLSYRSEFHRTQAPGFSLDECVLPGDALYPECDVVNDDEEIQGGEQRAAARASGTCCHLCWCFIHGATGSLRRHMELTHRIAKNVCPFCNEINGRGRPANIPKNWRLKELLEHLQQNHPNERPSDAQWNASVAIASTIDGRDLNNEQIIGLLSVADVYRMKASRQEDEQHSRMAQEIHAERAALDGVALVFNQYDDADAPGQDEHDGVFGIDSHLADAFKVGASEDTEPDALDDDRGTVAGPLASDVVPVQEELDGEDSSERSSNSESHSARAQTMAAGVGPTRPAATQTRGGRKPRRKDESSSEAPTTDSDDVPHRRVGRAKKSASVVRGGVSSGPRASARVTSKAPSRHVAAAGPSRTQQRLAKAYNDVTAHVDRRLGSRLQRPANCRRVSDARPRHSSRTRADSPDRPVNRFSDSDEEESREMDAVDDFPIPKWGDPASYNGLYTGLERSRRVETPQEDHERQAPAESGPEMDTTDHFDTAGRHVTLVRGPNQPLDADSNQLQEHAAGGSRIADPLMVREDAAESCTSLNCPVCGGGVKTRNFLAHMGTHNLSLHLMRPYVDLLAPRQCQTVPSVLSHWRGGSMRCPLCSECCPRGSLFDHLGDRHAMQACGLSVFGERLYDAITDLSGSAREDMMDSVRRERPRAVAETPVHCRTETLAAFGAAGVSTPQWRRKGEDMRSKQRIAHIQPLLGLGQGERIPASTRVVFNLSMLTATSTTCRRQACTLLHVLLSLRDLDRCRRAGTQACTMIVGGWGKLKQAHVRGALTFRVVIIVVVLADRIPIMLIAAAAPTSRTGDLALMCIVTALKISMRLRQELTAGSKAARFHDMLRGHKTPGLDTYRKDTGTDQGCIPEEALSGMRNSTILCECRCDIHADYETPDTHAFRTGASLPRGQEQEMDVSSSSSGEESETCAVIDGDTPRTVERHRKHADGHKRRRVASDAAASSASNDAAVGASVSVSRAVTNISVPASAQPQFFPRGISAVPPERQNVNPFHVEMHTAAGTGSGTGSPGFADGTLCTGAVRAASARPRDIKEEACRGTDEARDNLKEASLFARVAKEETGVAVPCLVAVDHGVGASIEYADEDGFNTAALVPSPITQQNIGNRPRESRDSEYGIYDSLVHEPRCIY